MGIFGLISIGVAMIVALGAQRLPFSSLLSIVFGYGALVALSVASGGDTALVLGFGGLSGLVLAYALTGHRRRRHIGDWDDLEALDERDSASQKSGSR
jgi:hypothetical protein